MRVSISGGEWGQKSPRTPSGVLCGPKAQEKMVSSDFASLAGAQAKGPPAELPRILLPRRGSPGMNVMCPPPPASCDLADGGPPAVQGSKAQAREGGPSQAATHEAAKSSSDQRRRADTLAHGLGGEGGLLEAQQGSLYLPGHLRTGVSGHQRGVSEWWTGTGAHLWLGRAVGRDGASMGPRLGGQAQTSSHVPVWPAFEPGHASGEDANGPRT